MPNDERYYNINKLNFFFAASSIILLVSLVWLFVKDYVREWKDYQNEFRSYEIQKTRVNFDGATNELEAQTQYQDFLKEFELAKQQFQANCSKFQDKEKEIEELRTKDNIVQQNYKFANADLSATKYLYENAKSKHSHNFKEIETKYLQLVAQVGDLKKEVEESEQAILEKEKVIDDCAEDLKTLEKKKRQFSKKLDIFKRKLDKIDPNEMSFINRIAEMVRDLPIIDLANPNLKIKQIVLKDVTDNVNYMHVPKVERCTTCHLGIINPDYMDTKQPFRAHPNLDLYVGINSPHPIEEFGCTVCHGGRSRGTDFNSSAHTPSSKAQKKLWQKDYNWHKLELWEDPMKPLPYIESGCFKCHNNEVAIQGAEKLNLGLHLINKAGCYNCHLIQQYRDLPKSGPDLQRVASKMTKSWAYKWIEDPQSFRHNTWMPAFFNQSNNSDAQSKLRGSQEIHAMVNFLFANSEPFDLPKIPLQGDAKVGEELVKSVGCMACHQIQPETSTIETTRDQLRQQQGPNLIGLGTKTSKEWLYKWIKNPMHYNPLARMPNLRLTDQEAANIVEFLASDTNKEFSDKPVPAIDGKMVDEITMSFLTKIETYKDAQKKLAAMTLEEKLLLSGEKLVKHYGCVNCHTVKGFEKARPIGTDLTEEGSKSIHNLDFGFIHIQHSNHAWFTQKLKDPRIFDEGKVKAPDEKLKMPNFNLSNEENEAIVTALLGFVNTETVKSKRKPRTSENVAIEEGQKVVQKFNCQSCHIIENKGGSIEASLVDWLVKYKDNSEVQAKAIVKSFSPPNLIGEGKKVQIEWLFNFLHHPSEIRPWLKVRMPTFDLSTEEKNTLIKYFNILDREKFPFTDRVDTTLTQEEHDAAVKLFSSDYLDCTKCHIKGNQFPGGSPENWAPNFALSSERLKPQWIIDWITNPADLLPGTKMPTYYDPDSFDVSGPDDILNGDEHYQIRVLRNYLLTITNEPEPKKEKPTPPSPAPTAEKEKGDSQ